jgi:hypothetical protein
MEGRQQPSLEELLNVIKLQRKALEFYAQQKNYNQNVNINSTLNSKVELDEGHQARFAIEQSNTIEEFNQSLIEVYKKEISEEKERFEAQGIDEKLVVKLNKLMLDLGNKKE